MAIRSLDELDPATAQLARQLLSQASASGIPLLVTETFRPSSRQDELYAQGRTQPGGVVTNARGGFSMHQFRCAFDVCPLDGDGKPLWTRRDLFDKVGQLGMSLGLEWGGSWHSLKDLPHFQHTGGLTLAGLRLKYGTERKKDW